MNEKLLIASERAFMTRYPGGFENEEMKALAKKHRLDKMETLVKEVFEPDKFLFPNQIVEDMIKVISRASMVSMFEKPKFRDFARGLSDEERAILASGLYEMLHGNMEVGFNRMLEILLIGKLGKWSLMTIIPVYYRPNDEVFVKPTTTKNVVRVFELDDIHYKPRPSYDFYKRYKAYILDMKSRVNPLVGVNNPAFTGFLMMTMDEGK